MVSLWWLLGKLHTTTWITHIKLISQGNFYQMIDVLYWTVKSIFSTLILCTNFWNDFFVHQDCIFEILYSFELSIKMISSSSTHIFDHKNRCWSFLFPYLFEDFCIIFRHFYESVRVGQYTVSSLAKHKCFTIRFLNS